MQQPPGNPAQQAGMTASQAKAIEYAIIFVSVAVAGPVVPAFLS